MNIELNCQAQYIMFVHKSVRANYTALLQYEQIAR
jgi:hypothetical protein